MNISALILTFLKIIFMRTIFKIFIVFVAKLFQNQYCLGFFFFGHAACGISAPQPGIEPTFPVLEGKDLTPELSEKSQF